jgi:formylglycine-generating enzyme required for sulfatase activity
VGTKKANELGIYDMTGNVWEWCSDWYGQYSGNVTNPIGTTSGTHRVIRSGGWINDVSSSRVAYRSYGAPFLRHPFFGFRAVRND